MDSVLVTAETNNICGSNENSPYLAHTELQFQRIPILALPARASSSGTLEILPPEVKAEVLGSLDFVSLGKLRETNYATKCMVESLPEFKRIILHAPGFLATLRERGLAHVNSLRTLVWAFNSALCETCAAYGSYFFPLTGNRCCLFCLKTNVRFSVISQSIAKKWFGPPSTFGLPSISRFDTDTIEVGTKTIEYFSAQKVKEACRKRYGRKQYYKPPNLYYRKIRSGTGMARWWKPDNTVNGRNSTCAPAFNATVLMPHLPSRMSNMIDVGQYCESCYFHRLIKSYLHTVSTGMRVADPWAKKSDREEDEKCNERFRLEAYTTEGLAEHLKVCKNLKASAGES